jgi:hypothetical protein
MVHSIGLLYESRYSYWFKPIITVPDPAKLTKGLLWLDITRSFLRMEFPDSKLI